MWEFANWLQQLQDVGLIAVAGLLGGIIGLEREIAGKPAGLRTHIFVCATSALFMVLGGTLIVTFEKDTGSTVSADPIRVMQAVVVGISFLGAGTILRQGKQERIEGLTTAASILLVAGIGIAVAMGQMVLATSVTILSLIVLVVLGFIEKRVHRQMH